MEVSNQVEAVCQLCIHWIPELVSSTIITFDDSLEEISYGF